MEIGGRHRDVAQARHLEHVSVLRIVRHVEAAFVRLRAYAYSEDRRLAAVASDIVARRLRLLPDADPDADPVLDGGL